VPQLFVATGADKWNDPKNHPWTMGWQPSYRIEARKQAGGLDAICEHVIAKGETSISEHELTKLISDNCPRNRVCPRIHR
jgi:hypothetical protein